MSCYVSGKILVLQNLVETNLCPWLWESDYYANNCS